MTFKFRLYVSGGEERCGPAIRDAQSLCMERLDRPCELEVIDVHDAPELARRDGIRAAPTLVMFSPGPVRKIVGDLSDPDDVIAHLGMATSGSVQQSAQSDASGGVQSGH